MTGFGHGEHRDAKVQLTLEMRSYNNRFLEVYVNLPYSLKQLEPRFRDYLGARVQRGKVELSLFLIELEDETEIVVDHGRVRAYRRALDDLRASAGVRERPTLAHFVGLEGVLKPMSRKDPEALWALVLPLLDRVFAQFQASRVAEGRRTEEDLRALAGGITEAVSRIASRVPEIEARTKTALRERFRDLLGDGIDESRILAETAVVLIKADINEEIQRLGAHLGTLREALGSEGPQGKRLDFICQELGREINTIGSKSTILEIDQAVIGVKDSLEKIREQIRNVE
jgi:uncharacterized protein (TIGR00255 family)